VIDADAEPKSTSDRTERGTMDRRLTRIAVLLVLGPAAVLGGCAGVGQHGKHTETFKEEQVERLTDLKAATNWDMAYQQYKSGDLAKALKTIDQSIALNDKVAKSHVLRARILFEMDRAEPALVSLDEAIKLDPTLTEAYYYRGVVLERVSQFDQAAESYRKAADLDTTDPQYMLAAAEMLIKTNRLDEAYELLAGGTGTFAHNAGIRQTLGHIAMMRSDSAEAVRLFSEASLLAPSDAGIQEDLARAQLESGDFAGANRELNRLINKDDPYTRPDLVLMRVQCLLALDKPVECRSLLQGLVRAEVGASDVQAWAMLGEVALKLNDQIQLRQSATRLMVLAPQQEAGYVLMAMWHKRNGTPAQGIDILDRATRVSDLSVDGLLLRCLLCQEVGDASGALASATQAAALDPTDERVARIAGALTANAQMAGVADDSE